MSKRVCVCLPVLTGCACELVSSQGHLVIPQAYQGQRTHKYQRQMPQQQQRQQQKQLHPYPLVPLFVFVCMEFLTSLSNPTAVSPVFAFPLTGREILQILPWQLSLKYQVCIHFRALKLSKVITGKYVYI